jgi:hypothetical protein
VPALPARSSPTFSLQIARRRRSSLGRRVITLSYAVSVEGGDCGDARVSSCAPPARGLVRPALASPSTGRSREFRLRDLYGDSPCDSGGIRRSSSPRITPSSATAPHSRSPTPSSTRSWKT